MRCWLWLAVLMLAGCSNQTRSLTREWQDARNLLRSERYDQALSKAESGLVEAQKGGDAGMEWRFLLLKAEILIGKRDPAAALAALNRDPPQGPAWNEARGKAFVLKARAASLLSRNAEADDLIARAEASARESGSASLLAEVELRRGSLLVRRSHFDEAKTAFRRVIDQAANLHDPYLQASAMGNLGNALLTESRYDEAIPWLEKARTIFGSLGANESVARATGNIGSCFLHLGNFDEARAQYERAQTEFARTGNRFEQQSWLGNAASVSFHAHDFAAAAANYERALAIARELHIDLWASRWLNNLAQTYIELGDLDRAEACNREALALKQRVSSARANSEQNAARIAAARKQFHEAEQLYKQSLSEAAEDPTVMLDTHADLAALYMEMGRTGQAQAEFEIAVAGITRLSAALLKEEYKFSYVDSLIRFYREYVDFLMARGDARRALEVAESSRSQVLAHRNGRAAAVKPQTAAGYEQLARRNKAVFLEYWLGQKQSYLWVITAENIRHYNLPAVSAIGPLVDNYRAVIMAQRDPLAVATETGRKLYDTLLAPARESLCQGCRVMIVPDEDLYALNFESLPAGDNNSRYLVEQLTLSIAPSLDYLLGGAHAHPVQPGAGLLVIGDPAPALAEYPKLEYAAREIESITSAMQSAPETVLRGADARPASYSEVHPGNYGLIHFSAHATANSQSPLDSAVILSGPPDRCKLFARDVMSVPLTAELVTISACRSAGAKTYAGEGPVGFAWAFLRAGAHNVIAGMWDVNDRSTAQLMAHLYEEIQRGASPTDALRTSKLALIHGGGAYAKPFYWAPFQVYTGASQ